MKEQLITFETAKLAKEKGFNNNIIIGNVYDINPTQSLLQKWLREVHNIHVEVRNEDLFENPLIFKHIVDYNSNIYKIDSGIIKEMNRAEEIEFKTYEEALEIGLQEGLKLIKIAKK